MWWKRRLGAIQSNPLHKQRQLELVAQGCVQVGFEHLQECRMLSLAGQPVPVLGHPHRGLGRAAEVGRTMEERQAKSKPRISMLGPGPAQPPLRDNLVTTLTNDSRVSTLVLRARRQEVLLSTLAVAHRSAGYASLHADQQETLV